MEPYQPILHTFPKDPLGRFQVLREFLRRWHNIDTGSAGHTCVRIDDAEARAGTPLPLGIREWIAFLDGLHRIGKTSVVEFSGGLIVAEKRGKLSYRLKAYAPNLSESHNDYYKALHGFRQRLRNEMGLPFS